MEKEDWLDYNFYKCQSANGSQCTFLKKDMFTWTCSKLAGDATEDANVITQGFVIRRPQEFGCVYAKFVQFFQEPPPKRAK